MASRLLQFSEAAFDVFSHLWNRVIDCLNTLSLIWKSFEFKSSQNLNNNSSPWISVEISFIIWLMSITSDSIFWNCSSRSTKSSFSKLRLACINCFCSCETFISSSSSLSPSLTLTKSVFLIFIERTFSDCKYFWTIVWNSETIFSSINWCVFSADENFTMEFNFLMSIDVVLMTSFVLFWMLWLQNQSKIIIKRYAAIVKISHIFDRTVIVSFLLPMIFWIFSNLWYCFLITTMLL